jgi:hypothetical protein
MPPGAPPDDQPGSGDLDAHNLLRARGRERHGNGLAAALDEDDALLRRQLIVVGVFGREDRRAVDSVVSDVGVLPIRA